MATSPVHRRPRELNTGKFEVRHLRHLERDWPRLVPLSTARPSYPSILMSASKASAPAPSAAEIQRKLSMHAPSPPSHKRRTSLSKSPTLQSALAVVEPDSELSALTPSPAYTTSLVQEPSPSQQTAPVTIQSPQLSVIAERPGGSGDESDDDDEDWSPAVGRSIEELATLNDENIAKAGYLDKKGERRKTWKRRWFVLRQTQLSYYKSDKEYKLLCLLPLSEIHSVTPVTLKRHHHTFGMVTPSRTYYVQASSDAEVDSWVRALNEAKARMTAGNPTGAPLSEGKKHVPPTINVQRSTPVNIQSSGPKTPPPLSSGSPSSPSNFQQHLTSSDSEDIDSYFPTSPVVGSSPRLGTGPVQSGSEHSKKIVCQGYLMKCGSKRKTWRKRWFVLTPETLIYAKTHMDVGPGKLGRSAKAISLNSVLDAIECTVSKHPGHSIGDKIVASSSAMATSASVPAGSSTGQPSVMASHAQSQQAPLTPGLASSGNEASPLPQLPHTFKIITPKRPLLLCAPSEEEEIKWLSAFRALIARRTGAVLGDILPPSAPGSSAQGPSQPIPVPSTPSKRLSRRDASTSGSPPVGEFVLPSAQASVIRKKESSSLTGVAASAMAVPASTA
ncbi:hypothetical protein FRB99_007119 [Tulasnella sp. 403]|nr:hypothetical protein FRB99_007119 [Tulasnella sp. 403]